MTMATAAAGAYNHHDPFLRWDSDAWLQLLFQPPPLLQHKLQFYYRLLPSSASPSTSTRIRPPQSWRSSIPGFTPRSTALCTSSFPRQSYPTQPHPSSWPLSSLSPPSRSLHSRHTSQGADLCVAVAVAADIPGKVNVGLLPRLLGRGHRSGYKSCTRVTSWLPWPMCRGDNRSTFVKMLIIMNITRSHLPPSHRDWESLRMCMGWSRKRKYCERRI